MAKKSREELIEEYKRWGDYNKEIAAFLHLPHEEKAKPQIFESFCKKHGGYAGILFSDDEICDSFELITIAKKYGFYGGYHLLSKRVLSNPQMALLLAECNADEYSNIAKELRDNSELMLEAVKIHPGVYRSLPVKVRINRNILLYVAEHDPHLMSYLINIRREYAELIFCDKELALIVAKTSPDIVKQLFSEKILLDNDIINTIFCPQNPEECVRRLKEYTWGLKYVDLKFWVDNRELVKKAVCEDGRLFSILPDKYKNDKRIVILAVRDCPSVLEGCSDELKDDADVLRAALQPDSVEILRYASFKLRADYDLVYKAVTVDALNLQYASDELRDNRDIVLRAIKTYGGVIEDASERLQNDEELKRIASKHM